MTDHARQSKAHMAVFHTIQALSALHNMERGLQQKDDFSVERWAAFLRDQVEKMGDCIAAAYPEYFSDWASKPATETQQDAKDAAVRVAQSRGK